MSRVDPVVSETGDTAPFRKSNPQAAADQNPAVLASFLGWTLDAFDYFLVVYLPDRSSYGCA